MRMSGPSQADGLVDDIIFHIFCDDALECKDIISLERVCKRWRDLASRRLLWQRHLSRLDNDHAPNLPPHINVANLSREALRDVVVRSHRSHHRWTSPIVTPSRIRTLKAPQKYFENFCNAYYRGAPLCGYCVLPGGKHMVVQNLEKGNITLDLFDVESECSVWNRVIVEFPDVSYSLIKAVYDENGSDILIVISVIGPSRVATEGLPSSRVMVLKVDLRASSHTILYKEYVKHPEEEHDAIFPSHQPAYLEFDGDIVSIVCDGFLLLLCWKTRNRRWIKVSLDWYPQRMHLFQGHLLCLVDAPYGGEVFISTGLVILPVKSLLGSSEVDEMDSWGLKQVLDLRDVATLNEPLLPDCPFLTLQGMQLQHPTWRENGQSAAVTMTMVLRTTDSLDTEEAYLKLVYDIQVTEQTEPPFGPPRMVVTQTQGEQTALGLHNSVVVGNLTIPQNGHCIIGIEKKYQACALSDLQTITSPSYSKSTLDVEIPENLNSKSIPVESYSGAIHFPCRASETFRIHFFD